MFPGAIYIPAKYNYGRRTQKITKIAIHHMVAVWTAQRAAEYFRTIDRPASANYNIGFDGSISMSVPEDHAAMTTSNYAVDNMAITIEVSNSVMSHPWPISDASMAKLIDLITYICKKYGIKECTYTGDGRGTLVMHRWYDQTSCPGPYLSSKFDYIAAEVNKRLGAVAPEPTPAPGGGNKDMTWTERVRKALVDAMIMSDKDWDKAVTKDQIASWFFTALQRGFFGEQEIAPAPTPKPTLKPLSVVAREVIDGLWGNGQDRINRLTAAGYNAAAVQSEVNRILGGK